MISETKKKKRKNTMISIIIIWLLVIYNLFLQEQARFLLSQIKKYFQ